MAFYEECELRAGAAAVAMVSVWMAVVVYAGSMNQLTATDLFSTPVNAAPPELKANRTPAADIVTLDRNYRSTEAILHAAENPARDLVVGLL